MTASNATTSLTPVELVRLWEDEARLFELVDGKLVEREVHPAAVTVTWEISARLVSQYSADRAVVLTSELTSCFKNPSLMRRPHVAMVWSSQLPGGQDRVALRIAPHLAVEAVSPTDTFDQVMGRVDEYLQAGVEMVWVVSPALRTLLLFRRDWTVTWLRTTDTLQDEPLLPGFCLRIADIFPAAPTAAGVQ